MEVVQRKSKQEKLVIQYEYMHNVVLKLLPKLGEYKTKMSDWL